MLLVAVVLAAAATLIALIACLLVLRQSRDAQHARLLLEQSLAGQRAEAETTRTAVRAVETAVAERLATQRGASDAAAEQARAALAASLAEGLLSASNRLADRLDTKLRELRESNDTRLAEIQRTVNEQLHAAVEKQMGESFNRVIDQFTAVQKAMGDVQAVTAQIGDIRRLFANVKTRGGWGEAQVKAMLDDILPPGAYETNKRVRPGSDEAVEFAVIMPMRGENRPLLPIDAKFPVEDYERLLAASETGDAEAERLASRALERRIREEAGKIAAKYIAPPLTVEFAVLYLPTDALYTEVARIPGLIDQIGRESRVLVMGPTLFPALLRTIHLGFVTLALEHKADQIRDLLGATRSEMLKMDIVLDRLLKQVGSVSSTIEKARTRTRAVGRVLRGVEQMDPDKAAALLDLETAAAIEDPGEDADDQSAPAGG
jgi:DNA recombination protein RmuC